MELDAVPRRRPDMRMRRYRGRLLVAGPESALELSDSAAFILREVDSTRSVRDIGVLLAREYDIPEDIAVEDARDLLADLAKHQIIDILP